MNASASQHPVAVIGAGPIGLAAASHLIARGRSVVIFEAGAKAGAHLDGYRHVRLFSPWRYNIDGASRSLLATNGWKEPDPDVLPTAGDVVDEYLAPLAAHPAIAPFLHLDCRVTSLTRAGFDKVKTAGRDDAPFVVRVLWRGAEHEFLASAVIDASGTWGHANPLGANGLPALGEASLSAQVAYGMPDVVNRDRARYAGKRVLVVGSGHSAAGNLIALAQLAEEVPRTRLAWAIRGHNLARIFGGGEADGLPARGELGQRLKALKEAGRLELHEGFRIRELRRAAQGIDVHAEAGGVVSGVDEIIAATGSRPNLALASELRLKLDPWLESTELLAPLIDPNQHSCGTVRPHGHRELSHPEKGYFAVGAKSYGRAPNFLMATGYEQVRSIAAVLTGDRIAADDVQLELPQTGVCSASFSTAKEPKQSGCCGGPPPVESKVQGCCVADVEAKVEGASGCGSRGCGTGAKSPEREDAVTR